MRRSIIRHEFRNWTKCVLLVILASCATYRDDLDRAMAHYDAYEYDHAHALLQVLEPDIDSLAVSQRAQYAYYRGMNHYRLLQPRDARHWLARAAAREQSNIGSLSAAEKSRLNDALSQLRKSRDGNTTTTKTTTPRNANCQRDPDCYPDAFCEAGRCKAVPAL